MARHEHATCDWCGGDVEEIEEEHWMYADTKVSALYRTSIGFLVRPLVSEKIHGADFSNPDRTPADLCRPCLRDLLLTAVLEMGD